MSKIIFEKLTVREAGDVRGGDCDDKPVGILCHQPTKPDKQCWKHKPKYDAVEEAKKHFNTNPFPI